MKTSSQKTFISRVMPNAKPKIATKLLFIAILFVSLASCQKEAIGPEGPAGQDGNANVTIITHSNQNIFLNPILEIWELTLTVPEITGEIMANGIVTVFLAPANSNNSSWTALPGMFSPDLSEIPAVHFNYQVSSGGVAIFTFAEPAFKFVDVKVAVIEGN